MQRDVNRFGTRYYQIIAMIYIIYIYIRSLRFARFRSGGAVLVNVAHASHTAMHTQLGNGKATIDTRSVLQFTIGSKCSG